MCPHTHSQARRHFLPENTFAEGRWIGSQLSWPWPMRHKRERYGIDTRTTDEEEEKNRKIFQCSIKKWNMPARVVHRHNSLALQACTLRVEYRNSNVYIMCVLCACVCTNVNVKKARKWKWERVRRAKKWKKNTTKCERETTTTTLNCSVCLLQEIDMIDLFGSPAGRAINKITSIKLNKSDGDAKARAKRITNGVDAITNDLLMSNSISGCGSGGGNSSSSTSSALCSAISSSSFSCISGNEMNHINRATPIATTTSIEPRKKTNAKPKYTNLHSKKVKCWKFIEEDKFNNNCQMDAAGEQRRQRPPTESIT